MARTGDANEVPQGVRSHTDRLFSPSRSSELGQVRAPHEPSDGERNSLSFSPPLTSGSSSTGCGKHCADFFFQAEDGIRCTSVTGVQTCALPICTVYRWEQSGELSGMVRVRGFTQDDAHLFCTEDQIPAEVQGCLDLVKIIFTTLDMKDYRVRVDRKSVV